MTINLLDVPQMLLIGSAGRNSGKTMLAIAFIRYWKNEFPIVGLKVTTIQERDGACPRGGAGCGVCSNLRGNFEIIVETNENGNKDTSRLLAAGAAKVYWLKTLRTALFEGIQSLLSSIGENALIICESTSLRQVIKPGSFIMVNTSKPPVKKSADEVMHQADIIIGNNVETDLHTVLARINVAKSSSGLAVQTTSDR